jgi:predicted RNA polymerase sigma factor
VPDSPGAWLLTAARRRVLDRLRAEAVAARKEPLLLVESGLRQHTHTARADPGGLVDDERLRLVLLCCHPALSVESSSALSLRLVIGLAVGDIARLFLAQESAVAARITRAKRKIVTAGMPFALPDAEHLAERVERVADVAYLAFTAGYVPGPGADLFRADLAGEAVRLLAVTRELAGPSPLLDSQLALMMLQHARRDARVEADGAGLVLLPDQDRSRWRSDEIARALGLLTPQLADPPTGRAGVRLLEALIAAEHAVARHAGDTRWDRIADAYSRLEELTGSPVVRLNRAVAVAEAEGPEAGLALLEGLDRELPGSHRLAAVRAELLLRTGELEQARAAFDEAVRRCTNAVERRHLVQRRALTGGT